MLNKQPIFLTGIASYPTCLQELTKRFPISMSNGWRRSPPVQSSLTRWRRIWKPIFNTILCTRKLKPMALLCCATKWRYRYIMQLNVWLDMCHQYIRACNCQQYPEFLYSDHPARALEKEVIKGPVSQYNFFAMESRKIIRDDYKVKLVCWKPVSYVSKLICVWMCWMGVLFLADDQQRVEPPARPALAWPQQRRARTVQDARHTGQKALCFGMILQTVQLDL